MSDEVATRPFTREDRWFVRVGATAPVGPVGTALLIKGIVAGRVPEDAWIRKEGELGWNLWGEVPTITAALRGEPLETVRDVAQPSSGTALPSSGTVRSGVVTSTAPIPTVPVSKMRPSLPPPPVPSSRELQDFLATPAPRSVRVADKGSAAELLASAESVSHDLRKTKTDPPGQIGGQAIGQISGKVVSASAPQSISADQAVVPIALDMENAQPRSPWPSASLPQDFPKATGSAPGYHRALPVLVITVFAIIGAAIMLLLLRRRPW
jgi:hypothetical protein